MRIRHLLAMLALATTLLATGCCWCGGHRLGCRRAYSAPCCTPCCECAPTCCYKPAEPMPAPHAP